MEVYLRKFWPFLTASIREIELKKHEFSVSLMLDKRALVATALGVQPLKRDKRAPLSYFVFTNVHDGRQIGRLVDGLTRMGTARIAALFNLGNLRRSAMYLKYVEDAIARTFKSISTLEPDTLKDDQGKPYSLLGPEQKALLIAQTKAGILGNGLVETGQHMSEALKQFAPDPSQDVLEDRVERARYYAEKFRRGVGALRISKLEGFLPYDEFVERRLGSDYDFMDLLSQRLGRVRQTLQRSTRCISRNSVRSLKRARWRLKKKSDACRRSPIWLYPWRWCPTIWDILQSSACWASNAAARGGHGPGPQSGC